VSHGRSEVLPSDAACTRPLAPISFSTRARLDVPSAASPTRRHSSPYVEILSAILWLTSTTRPLAGQW